MQGDGWFKRLATWGHRSRVDPGHAQFGAGRDPRQNARHRFEGCHRCSVVRIAAEHSVIVEQLTRASRKDDLPLRRGRQDGMAS